MFHSILIVQKFGSRGSTLVICKLSQGFPSFAKTSIISVSQLKIRIKSKFAIGYSSFSVSLFFLTFGFWFSCFSSIVQVQIFCQEEFAWDSSFSEIFHSGDCFSLSFIKIQLFCDSEEISWLSELCSDSLFSRFIEVSQEFQFIVCWVEDSVFVSEFAQFIVSSA